MRRLLSLALATGLAACSCDGGGTPPEPPLRTATPVPAGTVSGLASFGQAGASEDDYEELFPGVANSWILERNFALVLGAGGQYAFPEGALDLWVGAVGSTTAAGIQDEWLVALATTTPALREFPLDQTAAGLTYLTPLFGASDGVVAADIAPLGSAVPVIFGNAAGALAGTADSRLVRSVVLAPDQQYRLEWIDTVWLDAFTLRIGGASDAPDGPRYQVLLRDPATGAPVGDPLYVWTVAGPAPAFTHDLPISTGLGLTPAGPVDLSFELRSGPWGFASIDAVTLTTLGGGVPLDGDFERATLAPWTAVAPPRSQHVRSAPRIVAVDPAGAATVAVTRTFLAPPAEPWARMVDVLRNDGATPLAASVLYVTRLGALSPATALAAGGKAVVARDAQGGNRDLGLVFGNGRAAFDDVAVPGLVFVVHDVVVPPRGAVALVHFVVQLGQGAVGTDHAPAGTIAACEEIAARVRADPRYLRDLEPGVLGLVKNF